MEDLDLYACELQDPELATVLSSSLPLRRLNVRFNQPGPAFLQALAEHPTLEALKLQHRYEALAPQLPSTLKWLDLAGSECPEAALLGIRRLSALTRLDLSHNEVGPALLAEVLSLPALTWLEMSAHDSAPEPWLEKALLEADLSRFVRLGVGERVSNATLSTLWERWPHLVAG